MRDPVDTIETLANVGWAVLPVLACGIFFFGVFSAAMPERSITLYQRLMSRFNWRVSPIDERRELRTTKVLGLLLMLLSAVAWWRVVYGER
ncbi:MAG: hypothetical protein HYT90_00715 [Candidatus Omnitrophica bacterium]|nr:hypothetical protein [Candidatus Omnitrophota bacterium]